jgi:hypothetical protein
VLSDHRTDFLFVEDKGENAKIAQSDNATYETEDDLSITTQDESTVERPYTPSSFLAKPANAVSEIGKAVISTATRSKKVTHLARHSAAAQEEGGGGDPGKDELEALEEDMRYEVEQQVETVKGGESQSQPPAEDSHFGHKHPGEKQQSEAYREDNGNEMAPHISTSNGNPSTPLTSPSSSKLTIGSKTSCLTCLGTRRPSRTPIGQTKFRAGF